MDVCLLWELCVVRQRPLQWADYLSGGVSEYDWGTWKMPRPTRAVEPREKIIYTKN
jgi:hypothetical protein